MYESAHVKHTCARAHTHTINDKMACPLNAIFVVNTITERQVIQDLRDQLHFIEKGNLSWNKHKNGTEWKQTKVVVTVHSPETFESQMCEL